jgi:hypothetical protein
MPGVMVGPVSRRAPGLWRLRASGLPTRHWHHAVLLVWLAVSVAIYGRHGGQSWHFMATGARSLLCLEQPPGQQCGLHVYAVHSDLQIGPLSLLLAAPAVQLQGADGFTLARLGMALAGWVIVLLVERADLIRESWGEADGPQARRRRLRVLLAGLAFLPAWADLAVGFGHLDDVLALLFTALACYAVVDRRGEAAGWFLACATLSKPWAVAFLPLLLALPAGRLRALVRAVVPVAAVAALFVLADPQTLRAASFRIPNAAASSLRVLGVTDATPHWDRPVQFLLGILLGVWAVRLHRWRAVVMIAAATRIMLDPQVYSYYTASVLVGTIVWDIQERRGRVVPLWTWAAFAALFVSRYLPVEAPTLGKLRLGICLVLIAFALFAPGLLATIAPPRRRPASGGHREAEASRLGSGPARRAWQPPRPAPDPGDGHLRWPGS